MPSQVKIISTINRCLKQLPNIDVAFDKEGMCAGLSSLYIRYALQNKTVEFFNIFTRLSQLPKEYQIGDNPLIDEFIIQIERLQNSRKYTSYQVSQGELEKLLAIHNTPLRNEFNVGFITGEEQWEEILAAIARPDRAYFITSSNHAIALSFKNGSFIVYDPNIDGPTERFKSPKDLIQELKKCFEYEDNKFGLSIRVFSNPNAEPCVNYPTHEHLHALAFPSPIDRKYTYTEDSGTRQSSTFASVAGDKKTLALLSYSGDIQWDKLPMYALFNQDDNELLLKEPKSLSIKQSLLKSIELNILLGNAKLTEKMIKHYEMNYTTEAENIELLNYLAIVFNQLHLFHLGIMTRQVDVRYFIGLYAKSISHLNANFYHLQLLELFYEKANQGRINTLIDTLTPEQLLKQIYVAALCNQQNILNCCIQQAHRRNIQLQAFPSIFTEELINTINEQTLRILCDHQIQVQPLLLLHCLERKDISIFEHYVRAYLAQSNQSAVWTQVENPNYRTLELNTPIGNITLLDTLIVLKKNQPIKSAWQDTINDQTIESALMSAISTCNDDMSVFLKEKLDTRGVVIDIQTLELFYQKALKDKDVTLLSTLSHLDFNILSQLKDVEKTLLVCKNATDFAPIIRSFHQTSLPVKKRLLGVSLDYKILHMLQFYNEQAPDIYRDYFVDIMQNLDDKRHSMILARFERNFIKLPQGTLDNLAMVLDTPIRKKLFRYCLEKKQLKLAEKLSENTVWDEGELERLLDELLMSKNEIGIIKLLKLYPSLQKSPDLTQRLIQINALDGVNYMLIQRIPIEENLYQPIFELAVANNHKQLIETLITIHKVPSQPQLSDVLQRAIKEGKDAVLEPFITAKHDLGIDFKSLLLISVDSKKLKITNLLLTKNIPLGEEEINAIIGTLFDKQSPMEIFDAVYQEACGRLYGLLLKANVPNPKTKLLKSVTNPLQDIKFQKTTLYLSLLKHALLEEDTEQLNKLLKENDLPEIPDGTILSFINQHLAVPRITSLFEQKYPWKDLLAIALVANEWGIVAILLEAHSLDELSQEEQIVIQKNGEQIIKAFTDGLEKDLAIRDTRPRLFNLLNPLSPACGLKEIVVGRYQLIFEKIVAIESKMFEQRLDLNGQIYRHLYRTEGLLELQHLFLQADIVIERDNVDLSQSMQNDELLQLFSQIKILIAANMELRALLGLKHQMIFMQLVENPRFRAVCELEVNVCRVIGQLNFNIEPLAKKAFEEKLSVLQQALSQQHLPNTFVLPQIQSYLASKDASILKTPSMPVSKTMERQCLDLIEQKLRPLTNCYLTHLLKEIKKTILPALDIKNISAAIISVQGLNLEEGPLLNKFKAVVSLHHILTKVEKAQSAVCVADFYRTLDKNNNTIKTHRDPFWSRFLIKLVTAIGIFLTGILPGLAALGIFSAVTGRSVKFWKSHGEMFIDSSCEAKKQEVDQFQITPSGKGG